MSGLSNISTSYLIFLGSGMWIGCLMAGGFLFLGWSEWDFTHDSLTTQVIVVVATLVNGILLGSLGGHVIYVRRRNGRWSMWEDSMSEEDPDEEIRDGILREMRSNLQPVDRPCTTWDRIRGLFKREQVPEQRRPIPNNSIYGAIYDASLE